MRKKDRTSEEKKEDGMLKTGIMHLGPAPDADAERLPFPYVLFWDRLGRRGQRVKILRQTTLMAHIEFEDGFRSSINRMALRRY